MTSDTPSPEELGLEQHTFDFTCPNNNSTSLTVFCRKTLSQTLNFKTTMQCEVDELFESLRDFGGGYVPELFVQPHTTQLSQDNDSNTNTTKPEQQLISDKFADNAPPDHLGLDVWPAAIELCSYLAQHPELVAGCDILELGAGVGLPGLLAAKLGAKTSLLTDYEQSVVAFSGKNAALNGVSDNCSAFTLNWTKLEQLEQQHRNAYSLVLAADVLYVQDLMPWFVQAAETLMAPGGILLVGHQSRRALVINPETSTPEVQDRDVAFERFQKLCDDSGLCIRILGSRESEGFPGPFYMFAAARKGENEGLEKLPAAVWPVGYCI